MRPPDYLADVPCAASQHDVHAAHPAEPAAATGAETGRPFPSAGGLGWQQQHGRSCAAPGRGRPSRRLGFSTVGGCLAQRWQPWGSSHDRLCGRQRTCSPPPSSTHTHTHTYRLSAETEKPEAQLWEPEYPPLLLSKDTLKLLDSAALIAPTVQLCCCATRSPLGAWSPPRHLADCMVEGGACMSYHALVLPGLLHMWRPASPPESR